MAEKIVSLRPRVGPLAALILLALAATLHPVPLVDFVQEQGLVLEWEPYLEMGRLKKGGLAVRFSSGQDWMTTRDSRILRTPGGVFRDGGRLMLSEDSTTVLSSYFKQEQAPSRRIAAIVIDPGHGGKDPGTIGRHTVNGKPLIVQEKDVVLAVSLELERYLAAEYPDKEVLLSRNTDNYLTLEERTALANSIQVDPEESVIFVSIHANASLNSAARGFEVWYLPPDYRRDLLDPSKVQTDTKEILPILNTLLEEEFTIESVLLARSISEGLEREFSGETENRGLKKETWFVVRKAKMPSVLVEVGFVTNEEEAQRLNDPAYLHRTATAIYNGIVGFVTHFEKAGAGVAE